MDTALAPEEVLINLIFDQLEKIAKPNIFTKVGYATTKNDLIANVQAIKSALKDDPIVKQVLSQM